jgi:hypothetical protein
MLCFKTNYGRNQRWRERNHRENRLFHFQKQDIPVDNIDDAAGSQQQQALVQKYLVVYYTFTDRSFITIGFENDKERKDIIVYQNMMVVLTTIYV